MSPPRKLLLLSNSTLHPTGYLEYAKGFIKNFLEGAGAKSVLFVPYALGDMDEYANTARGPFEEMGLAFSSIHLLADPVKAVQEAEAVFVGGGNTFRLLKKLYDEGLIKPIR